MPKDLTSVYHKLLFIENDHSYQVFYQSELIPEVKFLWKSTDAFIAKIKETE